MKRDLTFVAALLVFLAGPASASAQPRFGQRGPQVISPEVKDDHTIAFRLLAPSATAVQLSAGDIPGLAQGGQAMTKGAEGVWETTVGPVAPGAYRYHFNVDGVAVIDPRNPSTSESNANTWSLVQVSGAPFMDLRDVPHGAVARIDYFSQTLQRFRRLHVYTPPGYEKGEDRFPVFYLLHGAFDCDASWSTVGRAGWILDNLIADGKARPMIVVMPAGHTGPFRFGTGFNDEFERDFSGDILPLIEARYRVREGRANRALAGLSMGGAQTLNVGIPHLDQFSYLGVFSSGVFGIAGGPGPAPQGPSFEERHAKVLDDPALKEGLKLFWFATGKDDFLVETSRATVAMFKKHQFNVTYQETEGAHTWMVWREYLRDFAPQLFQ